MPVRISKFINGYVTPEDVGPDLKTRKGLPPFMLSFTSDYKPVMTWNTTRTCNLRCVHCYSDSETKSYANELTHEEAIKMLDDMAEYGVPILLFSGGEPLMRKRVFELMAYARKIGVRPTLSTNGTLISRQVAANMKKAGLGYAGISMDGYEGTNDKFRGKEGAFVDMVKGVDNCLAEGVKIPAFRTVAAQHSGSAGVRFPRTQKPAAHVCLPSRLFRSRQRHHVGRRGTQVQPHGRRPDHRSRGVLP